MIQETQVDKETGEIQVLSVDEVALCLMPHVIRRCTHIKVESQQGQDQLATIAYGLARAMQKQSAKFA